MGAYEIQGAYFFVRSQGGRLLDTLRLWHLMDTIQWIIRYMALNGQNTVFITFK